ncbi:unnamed protein product, partial [Polarella glacialis]
VQAMPHTSEELAARHDAGLGREVSRSLLGSACSTITAASRALFAAVAFWAARKWLVLLQSLPWQEEVCQVPVVCGEPATVVEDEEPADQTQELQDTAVRCTTTEMVPSQTLGEFLDEAFSLPTDLPFGTSNSSSSTSDQRSPRTQSVIGRQAGEESQKPDLAAAFLADPEQHEAEAVPAGFRRVAGFLLSDRQLPPGWHDRDLEALVAEVQESCSEFSDISRQQALRLLLGVGYDTKVARDKWHDVTCWRELHGMHEVRARMAKSMHSSGNTVHLSHEAEVYSKLLRVRPFSLVTTSGLPVSVWHAGSLCAKRAPDLASEHLANWSLEFFEYADLWISEESARTGRLQGYVQVFDMQGLSWRHVTASEIAEKMKLAFRPGGFYVEAVAHIYIVNSSMLFSIGWNVVKTMISPWTASKVTVSSSVPEELIAALGGPASSAAASLESFLSTGAQLQGVCHTPEVLRPAGVALRAQLQAGATSPRNLSDETASTVTDLPVGTSTSSSSTSGQQQQQQQGTSTSSSSSGPDLPRPGPVRLPGHDEVYSGLLRVSPCGLVAADGSPVSVWHLGTLQDSGGRRELPSEDVVAAWGASVFQYADLWVTSGTSDARQLGHLQIFDMRGFSWRRAAASPAVELLRHAFHA